MDRSKWQDTKATADFMARVLYWTMYHLRDSRPDSAAAHVERWADEIPNNAAIFFEDRCYTYAQFNDEANRVAHGLRRIGARTDDAVALLMDNRPEYLFSIIGANKLGMVTGLINTKLVGEQLKHALKITKAKWIIVGANHADKLAEILNDVDIDPSHVIVWPEAGDKGSIKGTRLAADVWNDAPQGNPELGVYDALRPFLYICTSGTTGLPKAALIRNQRWLRSIYYFGQGVLRMNPNDVSYTCGMPLYHNAGISQGWGVALTGGGAVAIRRKFSVSAFWDDVSRYNVTTFTYIGEICRFLLGGAPHPKERTHRLRAIIGAGLRPDIWVEFRDRFAIPQIYEYYGATEGNVGLVNLTGRPGMVGRMMHGQVLACVDPDTEEFVRNAEGHLVPCKVGESGIMLGEIQKTAGFDGYVDKSKNASKVLENPFGKGKKYFNTGDLLTLHDNKYVAFADRLGDTFRWKGENVSTNDVQESLTRYEGVAEASVYGVKIDNNDGRAGMAAIVATEDFSAQSLAAFVCENLPAFSRPVFVRVEKELPMTGSYKYIKTGFKRDGFDPAVIKSKLFFLNDKGKYVKVTPALYKKIQSGTVRV